MHRDIIPRRDGEAVTWMQTFARRLMENGAAYMVSQPEAAGIQRAVDAFSLAYTAAIDPARRTPVNVAIKDETRNAAEQLIRKCAILIKYNAGIDDADKLGLGVRPVNPNRSRIDCPQTAPKLDVIAGTFGTHTLTYRDSINDEIRAKPFGAAHLNLYIVIGEDVITDPQAARYYGHFTRNPITVKFEHADNRRQATYFSRWTSRRGDVGPWSNPVSLAIAA